MVPRVSVIIPTYNRAHLLPRAIRSVLCQTFDDFELIVVDDCSDDDTERVVRSFDDSRIIYVRNNRNEREAGSRNRGVRTARANYLAFLDSDDEWLPRKLEKQMALFEGLSGRVGVVYSGFCFAKGEESFNEFIPLFRGDVHERMLKGCFMVSITPIVRKECFAKEGLFDGRLPRATDWDMWIRISEHFDFEVVPEVLAKYHIHGSQLSSDLNSRISSWRMLIQKYAKVLSVRPKTAAIWFRRLGVLCCISQMNWDARRYLRKSIGANPLLFATYLLYVATFIPLSHFLLRRLLTQNREGVYLYH